MLCHVQRSSGAGGTRHDDHSDNVPPPNNDLENPLRCGHGCKDDWHLRNIPPSRPIDISSSLGGKFSAIRDMCRLYGLDVPVNDGAVF